MEIVVVGRHTEVADRFRRHVEDKLTKVEKLAPQAQRIEVEVRRERNPRQASNAEKVELTVRGKGPIVRAEASAADRYGALDVASARLMERLRRARDRKKDHGRKHAVVPAPEPVAVPAAEVEPEPAAPVAVVNGEAVESYWGDSPVIIREKVHEAVPMTIDDALYEMELVGHDFYLFVDAETAQPSVAYRRHGWMYGVIRLDAPVRALAN